MPLPRSEAETGFRHAGGLTPAVDWLDDAERAAMTLGSASPLGTVLVSLSAPQLGAAIDKDMGWGVTLGTVLLGYAARLTDELGAKPPSAPAIEAELPYTVAGDIDYDALARDAGRVHSLSDQVAELVGDLDAVGALTGRTHAAWKGFAVEAASRLRHRFIRRGLPGHTLPGPHGFDLLLRLGYVVRCVDELAGEWPARRANTSSGAAPRSCNTAAADLHTETWLRQASAICTGSFEPEIEDLLERGALWVLDEGVAHDEDQVSEAVAAARLGFALREFERRWGSSTHSRPGGALLTEADRVQSDASSAGSSLLELLRDVIRYGYCGGAEVLADEISGVPCAVRGDVFAAAIERCDGGERVAAMREVPGLLHLGYLLRWMLEVRPGRFRVDLAVGDGDGCR